MTETTNNKKIFNAAIMTPYLTENMEAKGFCECFIQEQIKKYGYDPQNLNGYKFLETDKFLVRLHTRDDHTNERSDLLVIGSALFDVAFAARIPPHRRAAVAVPLADFAGRGNLLENQPEEIPGLHGVAVLQPKLLEHVQIALLVRQAAGT